MSQSRPYVNLILGAKHKDKGLLGAIAIQRPFDSADYSSIKDKRQSQIELVSAALNKLTLPPTTDDERKKMIIDMHACYQKIGNEVVAELKQAMREKGFNGTEEELNTQAIEAGRNYLFNFITDLKSANPDMSKSTETFLNDLTMYYHKDNPIQEFDLLYKERLATKCDKYIAATTYMTMVNDSYFNQVLKTNHNQIWKKFNNLLTQTNFENEQKEMTEYRNKNEKAIIELKEKLKGIKSELNNIDENIFRHEDKVRHLRMQVKHGYTVYQSELDRSEEKLIELKEERKQKIEAFKNNNKDMKDVNVVTLEKSLYAANLAFQDANNKLNALSQIDKLKDQVQESKGNKLSRFIARTSSKIDVKKQAQAHQEQNKDTKRTFFGNVKVINNPKHLFNFSNTSKFKQFFSKKNESETSKKDESEARNTDSSARKSKY